MTATLWTIWTNATASSRPPGMKARSRGPLLHLFSSQKHMMPSLPRYILHSVTTLRTRQLTALRHADVVHHEQVDIYRVGAGPPHVLVRCNRARVEAACPATCPHSRVPRCCTSLTQQPSHSMVAGMSRAWLVKLKGSRQRGSSLESQLKQLISLPAAKTQIIFLPSRQTCKPHMPTRYKCHSL